MNKLTSCLLAAFVSMAAGRPAEAQTVVFSDDFSRSVKMDNPWSCVDSAGRITMQVARQLSVDDAGHIVAAPFGPSIAVADLNGDGLPDLVVADSVGFLWYFQNHGTKTVPKFTTPEVMPIWLGDPCPDPWASANTVPNNIVPSIQVIDYDGDGKLDLVVGSYPGKLYFIHNDGSATAPVFRLADDPSQQTVPTRTGGILWCNYLAPFLYDWRQNGNLDLFMGEGSYSANSIFYFMNKGGRGQPTFNESNMAKTIPGMGREHLAPKVLSWNGDGKADILTAERAGFINLFLNQGANSAGYPAYDQGQRVSVGGQVQFEQNLTATTGSLNGSNLPSLLIGKADGHIYLAPNIGQPNNFKFGPATPLMATPNTRPPILSPIGWYLDGGYGSPYNLLVCTNAQVEPGFTPPDPSIKSAIKFYIDEPAQPNPTFPTHYYPSVDSKQITLAPNTYITLAGGTRYRVSFWDRADGDISGLQYNFYGQQFDAQGQLVSPALDLKGDVNAAAAWDHFTTTVSFDTVEASGRAAIRFRLRWKFAGKGSLYIAGLKIEKEE